MEATFLDVYSWVVDESWGVGILVESIRDLMLSSIGPNLKTLSKPAVP